jgi:hypothetical protein
MNAVGLGKDEEARELVRQVRRIQPTISLTAMMKSLGDIAPDVGRRMTDALRTAGLE